GRDHVSGCEPDAEQAALALGNDLELHALAIEPGNPLLELTERRPLRLADGLARGLDGDRRLGTHLRVLPPRFRLTRREPPPELALDVPSVDDCSPLLDTVGSSFGGVRLERLGGTTGRGIWRRVMTPWPVVQRFVVSQ